MKNITIMIYSLLIIFLIGSADVTHARDLGHLFPKENYNQIPLPVWKDAKSKLPIPILDTNPGWIEMYWKNWEIAFRGLKQPSDGSPFVSNWLDEAFSENVFQWDTIFMTMFARYGHHIFPAIESLDNFYCRQQESGFIGREYREKDGKLIHFDFDGGLFSENGFKNTINPPLFSWAEVESYRMSGDKSRLQMVLPVLEKYAEWLNRDGNPAAKDWESNGRISKAGGHKLYWNTPLGSGMDNAPRPTGNGAGWVDMSAQMVLMYKNLAIICDICGKSEKAEFYRQEAQNIGERINKWCWNEEDGFYYDVLADGQHFKKKTSAGFWPLLAGIASRTQAEKLVAHLIDEEEFWRKIPFPTLAADEQEYHSKGGYWQGGVWAPTNVMIIKGLEKYGYYDLARKATEKYLTGMHEVFKKTKTVYENYAPDYFEAGNPSKADFVGWTGCGPIQLLIENVIGLHVDGANNLLVWRLQRTDFHGITNLNFGHNRVSLISEPRRTKEEPIKIMVQCERSFHIKVVHSSGEKIFNLKKGSHDLEIR